MVVKKQGRAWSPPATSDRGRHCRPQLNLVLCARRGAGSAWVHGQYQQGCVPTSRNRRRIRSASFRSTACTRRCARSPTGREHPRGKSSTTTSWRSRSRPMGRSPPTTRSPMRRASLQDQLNVFVNFEAAQRVVTGVPISPSTRPSSRSRRARAVSPLNLCLKNDNIVYISDRSEDRSRCVRELRAPSLNEIKVCWRRWGSTSALSARMAARQHRRAGQALRGSLLGPVVPGARQARRRPLSHGQ